MKYLVLSILLLSAANASAKSDIFQVFAEESWTVGLDGPSGPTTCAPAAAESAKQKAEQAAFERCKASGYRTRECSVIVSEIAVNGELSARIRFQYGLTNCDPRRDPGVCDYLGGLASTYGCIAKAVVLGKMEE